MINWLSANPLGSTPTITREQLSAARRKIRDWMREQYGVRQQEALTTIVTVTELKQEGKLDPKMRILAESLEGPPHGIDLLGLMGSRGVS